MIYIHLILMLIACFVANIVGTISGFGVGTVLTPTLLYFFDIKETILLVCIVHLFHDVVKFFFFYKKANIPLAAGIGMAGIISSIISSLLLAHWQTPNLTLPLGIFLLSYTLFIFLSPTIHIKKNWFTISLAGVITGFIAGIFGIFGAIRSTFLLSFNPDKKTFVGTSALISCLINSTRLITYLLSGMTVTNGPLIFLPFLIIMSFLGTFAGQIFVHRIPNKLFNNVVLIFISIAALRLIMHSMSF